MRGAPKPKPEPKPRPKPMRAFWYSGDILDLKPKPRNSEMEKVKIRFNKANKGSTDFNRDANRCDIQFLQECFEISYKRAQNILHAMKKDREHCSTDEVEMNLTYRQLARYVAMRQVSGLNKYWKYPHVLEHIEEDEEDCQQVIEIRPGVRTC